MTQKIIQRGIRDTNTFCMNCLKPRMYSKRFTICECGSEKSIVNLPSIKDLKDPIYKLGVELEGTWFDTPTDDNLLQREDGSVEYNGDDEEDSYRHTGEYIFADPMPIKPYSNWERVIRNGYPEDVNNTCGGHIHTSWKDLRFYSILMDQEMAWELVDHMRTWGYENLNTHGQERLFNRLDGNEHYTQMKMEPELQIHGNGERYTFFNFPYEKHGTIECRFLPQFEQADTYILAVHEILGFMESWVRMKCGSKDRYGVKNWRNERSNTKITFKGQITREQVRKHLRKQFSFTSSDCDWAESQV